MAHSQGPLASERTSASSNPPPHSLFNKPGGQISPVHADNAALRPDPASQHNASRMPPSGPPLLSALPAGALGPDGSIAHLRSATPPAPGPENAYYPGYAHKGPLPGYQHPQHPQHLQHPPPHLQQPPQHLAQPPQPYGYAPGRLPPPPMRPPAMGYYSYYPYSADLQRMPPVDQGDASHPKLPRINVDPRVEERYDYQAPQPAAPAPTRQDAPADFEDRPPPKKRGRKRIEVAEVLANNDLSHCSPLGEKELEADHRKHKRPSRPQAAETTTGERQYPCTFPGCEWSFVRISDQRRHLRSHQEPLFVCPFYAEDNSCHRNGGSFTRSDVLKRHLRLVHFVQFKQSDSGWCRYCEKIFPSHKFFLDHCDTCAVNNKRKTRKGAPDGNADLEQPPQQQPQLQLTQPHQPAHMPPPQDVSHNEIEADQEPEADLELLSTASSMLAKEPGELPILGSHAKGQEDLDRHQKRKGRSSKSSLSGTIQAGHHL
ncbi:hypothetical protein CJU89_1684 [Yarrowia sp. B02]|nr:hypothetical protein CJU89_1684 [Yarrowia sp. B02]